MRLVVCRSCHTQFDVTTVDLPAFACPCGTMVQNARHLAVDAEIRRCGSCGAAVENTAAACTYCASPVVRDQRQLSLVCPECYARNVEATRFCTNCGVGFRPQPVQLGEDTRSCPACEATMTTRTIAGIVVEECPQCSGLWIPDDGFDALVTRALAVYRERPRADLAAVRSPRDERRFQSTVVYRRCPVCRNAMCRKNFARRSGVIVDWCGMHGTWLDADELEHIAAFVLRGGVSAATTPAGQRPVWSQPADEARVRALAEAERIMAKERAKHVSMDRTPGSIGELLLSILG